MPDLTTLGRKATVADLPKQTLVNFGKFVHYTAPGPVPVGLYRERLGHSPESLEK